MKVRAKFKCESVTKFENGSQVKLRATNQKDGDNQDWSQWTPAGALEMTITNPPAENAFAPGKFYFVDIGEVSIDIEAAPE
jgi:hypothetical protein